ncbi:MAG: amino acid adenylation domain-containing protein [Nannocystaceae bacterium]
MPLASTPAPGEVPRFARQSGRLDPERWRGLKARAAREGLTPSGILCAAYAEVLGAWSGSERFLVNVTTFSRLPVHPAVDRLVGDFTSILLLEVDRAGATLRDRARALQAQLAADLEHLEVSGVRVLREARRRGIEVAAPVVFTSALVHQDDPRGGFPELLGRRVEGLAQTPQVWLDHVVFEEDGALIYVWDAVEALFPPGVLKDMFAAYEALVAALADDEARWRRPLRSLTPAAHLAERAALQGDAGPPPAGLLHHGFEARAAADPAATAVIDGDRALSYGALASWSRRIARALGAAGVAPGSKVAITLEKGAAQVAAALAASMAGVAYVPIDPALPPARLRRLYPHAEVAAAITREGLADGLPPGPARICVDDPALATVDDAPLPDRAAPGDLAYVIYTSGSTGEPKGVMIDHRGALNTIDDVHRRFGVGPSDRVLALSSLSFDLSVYDLFGLLSAGGALVIPPPGSERDPAAWSALCRAHRVTLWNSVPALMDMFVRHADGRPELAAPDLRLCLLSGDWIPVRLPDAIRALHPGAAVVSLGGATEASIWSIAYPIGAVDPAWTSIPYGRPLTRQGLHVLDARLEPCPIWVPGHLYITGVGVALGYLGDPERTAASFLALPSGERAYRTGDLGRYLPGGDLEFLGREDLQVKIQGYRVELGEIEAALAEHPEVEAAVAVARGEARGARRLVTYAVARAGGAGPADAALQKLSEGTGRPDLAARPRVALPGPPPAPADYRGSQSVRAWLATPTPLAALGRLLAAIAPATLPESPLPKRRYPSAGGLYPVHAYVLARAVEGLEAGAYWLDPRANSLVWVGPGRLDPADHGEYNRAFVGDAAFTVVLVADLAAIEPRYGDRARDFCLLEAGAIAQLLRSEAPAAGVGLCAIGSIAEAPLRAALALGDAHAVVHALVGGAVAPGRFDRVELAPAAAPLGERLRDHLAARLPAYMVPAQVVLLPALPLGATGKVDRARLPAPEDNLSPRPEDSPADPRERELAALVAELLGVAEVGASTPFFAAGATSLHLVRLHAALRERFAVDLPIVEVFRHPTIRALAARLDRAGAQGGAPEPGADADADAAASERGLDRARARLAARRGGRR